MKILLLFVAILLSVFLVIHFLNRIRVVMLPGNRRLVKNLKGNSSNEFDSFNSKIDVLIKNIIPKKVYQWIELLLYQTGQSFLWSVTKTIRFMFMCFLFGCFISFLIVLIYIGSENFVLLILAIIFPIISIVFPLFIFKFERKSFLSKIYFQTPELLDVLERQLVYDNGDIIDALGIARKELDGELQMIINDTYQYILIHDGDISSAMNKIMKKRIDDPLYDQIVLMLDQYRSTGKIKKLFQQLQFTTKTKVSEFINMKTSQKNILLALASMGLLINLSIIVGIPIMQSLLDQF